MVISPKWVMYQDTLYRAKKQIGEKLYLIPNAYIFGWHDPRLVFSGLPVNTDSNYLIVDLSQCEPITQEVADIMRGV